MSFNYKNIQQINIPKRLLEIPEPPKRLFLLGENILDNDQYIYISVVGSRKASNYSHAVVKKIFSGLTKNFIIVSGLAFGVDTLAHKFALEYGLKTIAFPGSGLEQKNWYPAQNIDLAKKILEQGGALVSEFDNNQKASNWTFPKRNRLMAGISQAIIVIEAEEMSGSRITARLATDYNRDVFAVPGDIFSPFSIGTNNLIKEGAYPLLSADDLLIHFGLKNFTDKNKTFAIPKDLPDNAKKVLEKLQLGDLSRTELCGLTNLSISDLNICLSVLELQDLIEEKMSKVKIKYN